MLPPPTICVLLYRLPKYNKNFITQFSDLLSSIFLNCGSVLILGDFNIYVCCPEKPLVRNVTNLNDSFGLHQSVDSSTHKSSHILDKLYQDMASSVTSSLGIDDL